MTGAMQAIRKDARCSSCCRASPFLQTWNCGKKHLRYLRQKLGITNSWGLVDGGHARSCQTGAGREKESPSTYNRCGLRELELCNDEHILPREMPLHRVLQRLPEGGHATIDPRRIAGRSGSRSLQIERPHSPHFPALLRVFLVHRCFVLLSLRVCGVSASISLATRCLLDYCWSCWGRQGSTRGRIVLTPACVFHEGMNVRR